MTLIKREDAIEAVLTYFIPRSHTGERGEHEEDFVRTIFKALPSVELTLQTPQTYGKSINPSNAEVVEDLISRADAIRWVKTECNQYGKPTLDYDSGLKVIEHLKKMPSELPSAEVKPTVIRSKTLLPTKDFKEWAKRVRETNPNVIVIPCDAEVVSADAVQGWIPCSERLPKKGEVVLITNGKGNVRCGQYRSEHDVRGGTHYWWWKGKTVETVIAWMPLPKPYREENEE